MLKKAGKVNQTLKEQTEKLSVKLSEQLVIASDLIKTTGMPVQSPNPPDSVLEHLQEECDDHPFWKNFQNQAPKLFVNIIADQKDIKQISELSYAEELVKTRKIIDLMLARLDGLDTNIDVIQYSMTVNLLEKKMAILKNLSKIVEAESGDKEMTLQVNGTNKVIKINMDKLKESITFLDSAVEERQASAEDNLTKCEDIDSTGLTEETFMAKAIELIGTIEQNDNKTFKKDTVIKMFKYCGDFSNFRQGDLKQESQNKRVSFFEKKDWKQYFKSLTESAEEEKKLYDASFNMMFDKLGITQINFERSQEQLMQNDPQAQMESFNIVLSWDKPKCGIPEELTRELTCDLVMKANDFAFEIIKNNYVDAIVQDQMLMPLLVSAVGHDWVLINHKFREDQFKAALFDYKIIEDPLVGKELEKKQYDLMMFIQIKMQGMAGAGGMPGFPGGLPQGGQIGR